LGKQQIRTIKREIDRVLWDVWDPIGMKELRGPRDEYESYVDGVYELLVSGASDDAIAQHLHHIASDNMGLNGLRIDDMYPTVAALKAIRIAEESE